jgi:hypothetical protein
VSAQPQVRMRAPMLNNNLGGSCDCQKEGLESTLLCARHHPSSHPQSTSPIPSSRSSVSGITSTEEHSNSQDKQGLVKRRQTQRFDVKLSWWDVVKGLFLGPKWLSHKTVTRIETEFDNEVRLGSEPSILRFALTD